MKSGRSNLAHLVEGLVRTNLNFHSLNKTAESRLGLSLVQFYLLQKLRDMPACSPQILAHAAGMHPSTLTQSIKRLLKKAYIFVSEDPRDSRRKILVLTASGKMAIQRFQDGSSRTFDTVKKIKKPYDHHNNQF